MIILYYTILHYNILYYTQLYTKLYSIILYSTIIYYTIQYYYTILYSTSHVKEVHQGRAQKTPTLPFINHMTAAAKMTVGQVTHISFLSLLWTFPCRNCIIFIKDYLYSSSYNFQSRVHCWCWVNKKKKPNSQWHLAVICASVYHCSSNSDSETLITTMAPVWVTFWRVDLLMSFPLKQVIIAIFLPWLSLLQPLGWQNRQSTVEGGIKAERRCSCEASGRCSI